MDETHEGPNDEVTAPIGERRGDTAPVNSSGSSPVRQADGFSIVELISILLKHRRTIVVWTVSLALLIGVITLLAPRTYTAATSFFPQEAEGSRLGGAIALAGQLGISIPSGEPGRSPEFYADLLRSREILSRILTDTFTVAEAGLAETAPRSGTLLDLLEIDEEVEPLRREEGIEWLRDEAVRARTDQETGLVTVELTTPWPVVSAGISERLLELLNQFNLSQRRSQAMAERRFIEERLAEAQEELLEAEEELKSFLENNRAFQNSPELAFEHDRLQRQVRMRQEIFTSLNQSYEEARISEVRNTPVITVVERPEVPVRADRRLLGLKVLVGLVVGGMLGVSFALTNELARRGRDHGDDDYRELRVRWQETVDDLRRPFRRLGGRD